jgi:hypothetical protein
MLRLRKSVSSLTAAEKADLITAIKALKANGKYDQYVNEHDAAMSQATLMPGENPSPPQSSYRNVAHRGPAFGPWHREMLRRFELDLQAAVPGVTLPYWDWAADRQLADPKTAPVWDLLGGDGDPTNTFLVGTGPFKYDAADPATWRVVTGDGEPGPGLRRRFAFESGGHLPSQSDIDSVLPITPYDSPPWRTVSDPSFRNQLEGFMGPNLHNAVHLWVGGSMLPGTSPNDPVFFLHHCNVDRLWWQWQIEHPDEGYVPTAGGPPGHNLNDQMTPWEAATTPASTLDIHHLGYRYESDLRPGLSLVIDRSTFGQDEVLALLTQQTPAVIPEAFWVIVEGFTAQDLGLNAGNLGSPPVVPTVTLSPAMSAISVQFIGPVVPEDPTLPPTPQRFRFGFRVSFASDADFGFAGDFEIATVSATFTAIGETVAAAGLIELVKKANPYLLDGLTSWLSIDLRVFRLRSGDGRFSMTMGPGPGDAPGFIQSVIQALTAGGGSAGGESFEGLPTDEDGSSLELSPTDSGGRSVFNFALARVRMRGLTQDADNTRVFFRLFQAQTTNVTFDPATTYRRFSDGVPGGHTVPLLGIRGGEYVTVPCFASPRVDTASSSMVAQVDPPNVQTIPHDPSGNEIDRFFGCWLDINQPGQLVVPPSPPGANQDGPFSGTLLSIQQAIVRSPHQCLVAEIAFDPDAIPTGVDPSTTDKLAQRNLAFVSIPNPGADGSRRAPQTFEVRPTPTTKAPADERPDELMIDWGGLPTGTTAHIYLPAVSSDEVVELAKSIYTTRLLQRADDDTLSCRALGVTFVPLPPGADSDRAGLLTLDIPPGVMRGEQFNVLVRQITNAQARIAASRAHTITSTAVAVDTGRGELVQWRRVFGAFQVTVPVQTKAMLRPREERLLSILRWIANGIQPSSRWYPVFQRYLEQIGGRVSGLGGDPGRVIASPTGEWRPSDAPPLPAGPEAITGDTGKVIGLIYDRFGDFEGFLLETEHGAERRYSAREHEIEELVRGAWMTRTVITVRTKPDAPGRPITIVVRRAPQPFQR